ncbi:MAG: Asp-tRNA(Asn)/Glu-tRNA(Gln) amidotransferase subunit GatB [Parachlamydiales bacterium]|nr:Asp-tRNA(Asn)/Glu-tRNA(Gln) amidotransferase subunit GatB [Parachlamydiales bacterium]
MTNDATDNGIDTWEPIIGLEVHVELNTKSKLFSRAPNRFGDEPNTNISVNCTGQPGALPVLNREAVKKAVQFGLAVDAEINKRSRFDRKSYFYPDSPRNFQITQFDEPIVIGGEVYAEIDGELKHFKIHHAHLEDDAGMLKHFSTFAGVDDNRAGVPLIEIVSEPCIRSAKEATAYVQALKAILEYIDASDCNMEEGSLRMDTNISVRKVGETGLRNKIEIKNMNSFTNMEMAIDAEIKRQIEEYTTHADKDPKTIIAQSTCRWDPATKSIVVMRSKEDADDYRYYPEGDIPPVALTQDYIEEIKGTLPELPLAKKQRYINDLKLSSYAAGTLTSNKKTAEYFEEALKSCNNAQAVCNWITVEFAGRLKDTGKTLIDVGITPEHIAKLVNLIDSNKITGKIAKSVADDMVSTLGKDPEEIIAANQDYQPQNDPKEIEALIDQVLAQNANSIADFKAGKDRAFGFLVGQVMKLSRGKASPQVVNDLLRQKLEN